MTDYTDADVKVACEAITVARGLNPNVRNAYRDAMQGDWARAVLDAVAPGIAASAYESGVARGRRYTAGPHIPIPCPDYTTLSNPSRAESPS